MAIVQRYLNDEGLITLWKQIDKFFSHKIKAGNLIEVMPDDENHKIEVRCTIGDKQGIVVGNGDGTVDYIEIKPENDGKVLRVQLIDGKPKAVWSNQDSLPDITGKANYILSNDGIDVEWRTLAQDPKSLITKNELSDRTIYKTTKIAQASDGHIIISDDSNFTIGKGSLKINYTKDDGTIDTVTFNANDVSNQEITIASGGTYSNADGTIIFTPITGLSTDVKLNPEHTITDDDIKAVTGKAVSDYVTDEIEKLDAINPIIITKKTSTEKNDVLEISGLNETNGIITKDTSIDPVEIIVGKANLKMYDKAGSNLVTFNANANSDVNATIPAASINTFGLVKTSIDEPEMKSIYDADIYIDASDRLHVDMSGNITDNLDKAVTALQGVIIEDVGELIPDINRKVTIPVATHLDYGVDKKYIGNEAIDVTVDNEINVRYDDITVKKSTDNKLYVPISFAGELGVIKNSTVSAGDKATEMGIFIQPDGTIVGNYQPGSGIEIRDNYITATAGISMEVVDDHTLVITPNSKTIYLEPVPGTDYYTQWVYFNDRWWNIGDTKVDLWQYAKKEEVDAKIDALDGIANIASELDGVVTIKSQVVENNGVINVGGDDIVLKKVAGTGKYEDLESKLRPKANGGIEFSGTNNLEIGISTVGASAGNILQVNATGDGVEWTSIGIVRANKLTLTKNNVALPDTFTANTADATIALGDIVTDVYMNGASICGAAIGTNRVANIPAATNTDFGVVKYMSNSEIDAFIW